MASRLPNGMTVLPELTLLAASPPPWQLGTLHSSLPTYEGGRQSHRNGSLPLQIVPIPPTLLLSLVHSPFIFPTWLFWITDIVFPTSFPPLCPAPLAHSPGMPLWHVFLPGCSLGDQPYPVTAPAPRPQIPHSSESRAPKERFNAKAVA